MDGEYQKNEKFRELCYIGDLQLIKSFFNSNQPDLNSKNKVNGWTSLHWACSKNNLELINYLLEVGADKTIRNNDGKTAFEVVKDNRMRTLLGLNSETNTSENSQEKLVPNFVRNPQFHYADKNLFESQSNKETLKKTEKSQEYFQVVQESKKQEIITIRVRSNSDKDFIEFDIDRQNLEFAEFKLLCQRELEVDENYKVYKIRKLPNILIRNTNDIRRLKNEQEIEFVFSPND
ncbi:unnamed protein product [Brachionus calyciflorus]|uniref:Ankyrin repeat domain-containing protein 40 n=1 Tax=Brachionus calyciflorus TaxID=104777 RepID=A0A814A8C4_9BILA|nr:unnamed protein product [Brachionus calyciflorus]